AADVQSLPSRRPAAFSTVSAPGTDSPGAFTTTVPCMNGCSRQTYRYTPACDNVYVTRGCLMSGEMTALWSSPCPAIVEPPAATSHRVPYSNFVMPRHHHGIPAASFSVG